MRVLLTVVGEGEGAAGTQDVMLDTDDTATVADVAEAVELALSGDRMPPGRPGAAAGSVVSFLPGAAPEPRHAPGRHGGPEGPVAPSLWADGRLCEAGAPATALLRNGMRISTDASVGPLLRAGEPAGSYELRVAAGPSAGRVVRLGAGTATVGSAPTCTLVVPGAGLPPEAARLTIDLAGTATLTVRPGTSALLDDEPVDTAVIWPLSGVVRIGDALLVLETIGEPDAHLADTGEGGRAYNRPPRLSSPRPRPRIVVPSPPGRNERARFQTIAAFTPLVFGLMMYFVTQQIYMLLFCLMSPVMMLGQWASDSRDGKRKQKTSLKQYRKDLAAYEAELVRLGADERHARRTGSPDPAELLLFATGPRRRLWERRLTDTDVMRLRVGVGELPRDLELVLARGGHYDEEPMPPPPLRDVPVDLPMPELGVVGVAGLRPDALATARWLTAQSVVLHSPRDLSLVVLAATPEQGADWTWARWLPHVAPRQGQDCVALYGSDAETLSRRVVELRNELARRKDAHEHQRMSGRIVPEHTILVVLDGGRLLRRMAGVPQLLSEGPEYGIYAVCLDEDERLLPEECRAAVCWGAEGPAHVRLRGGGLDGTGPVLADQVGADWCELVARALAPIRDVSRDDADSGLPTAARLLNLLGMPEPTGEDVERAWKAGGSTTVAPIGLAADGPFRIDIRHDGPHALVAGTTGAGKSELLQTVIASLAAANRPDALNYVLIDYKGGSAFMDCARLPHTVGMVSDLDAHLTTRALDSLAAELRRREHILFESGTKDIEDYNDTRALRPELEAMPRLVLVIDEFAALVAELPDFIAGLVDIARRGRSLGVHLILATQRPAGVVSADIRANTNLRIALRVTDAAESSDVIDAPDAAAIAKATPGRAYVRSGAQSLVAVQSARIGGRRPAAGGTGPRATLLALPWSAYGRPLPKRTADDDGSLVTDLSVLVDAIISGSQRMGFPAPRSPWLPPLDDRVVLDELFGSPEPVAEGEGDAGNDVVPVPYGLVDQPALQSRAPLTLDLVHGEHTLLVGGARSGRSTALRTLGGAIGRTTSPRDVHVYAVDCGSNALLPLVRMPHVGAVVNRNEPDRMRRLIDRLLGEIARRQQLLAMEGMSSAAEQRTQAPAEQRLPWMVVLLDSWEGFTSSFENYNYGQLIEAAQRIFREGAAVGVKVVMTADRSGLSGQVTSAFADRLVLRFADPSDYQTAGIHTREVPKDMPSGRALRITATGVDETQIALLDADPAGTAQVRRLREIAEAAADGYGRGPAGLRPMRVDALPSRISAADALALDPEFVAPSALWALLAVGGDELRPIGIDLEESGPGFVVAGPPRSGRSTMLRCAAESLLARNTSVVLVAPRRSPLRELGGQDGVLGLLDADSRGGDLDELLDQAGGRPYVVVVDDADLLYDTPLDEALEEVVRKGGDGGHGVLAAGSTDTLSAQYRGFVVAARKSRNGLLLTPQSPQEGELFNVRLPANSAAGGPGSGFLVTAGALLPVQGVS